MAMDCLLVLMLRASLRNYDNQFLYPVIPAKAVPPAASRIKSGMTAGKGFNMIAEHTSP
jgi:hypothetical protein